jgi:four helix bundle protein
VRGERINSYMDLEVWQQSMALTEECYRLTGSFPKDEVYGITSQIRRSAVSIPANIAEGYGRELTGSFLQFLRISQGSAKELETLLLISNRVGLSTQDVTAPVLERCTSVSKMLRSLIRSLEAKSAGQ